MKKILAFSIAVFITIAAGAQRQRDPKLAALLSEKDSSLLSRQLTDLGKSRQEEDLALLVQYYSAKGASGKADSVFRAAVKRFPKGKYAYTQAGNEVILEKDTGKKEKLYKKMVKDLPQRDYSMQQYSIADAFGKEGNTSKMLLYVNMITDKNFQPQALSLLGEQQLQKGNLNIAGTLVKRALDSAKANVEAYDSSKKRAEADRAPGGNPQTTYNALAAAYSKVLLKKGDVEQAYMYAKEAYDKSNRKNRTINEQYVAALMATNRLREAFPFMEDFIKSGSASADIKSRFKAAYTAAKGSDADYEAYKEALDKAYLEKVKAEVAKMLIKEPSKDFTLTDVDGKIVTLHDLRGKVVILDFWATWCGPCKKSFPAMQMALNKYKNNPDVKFLFIHTWERGSADPTIEAKKYVSDHNFSFEVLMDRKDPVTAVNKVVTDYGIQGIPSKFVIDGNGNIRFKLTGFSGGDDAAVAELSAMIEMARTNS